MSFDKAKVDMLRAAKASGTLAETVVSFALEDQGPAAARLLANEACRPTLENYGAALLAIWEAILAFDGSAEWAVTLSTVALAYADAKNSLDASIALVVRDLLGVTKQ